MTISIVPSITDEQLADIEQYVTTTQRESSEVPNSHIAAIIARLRAADADARLYRWLRSLECNQWILSRDEAHASNYVTAKQWIEDFCPEEFEDCDSEELERMKQANTIWKFQIYPRTPIGFNHYHAATLDDVVKAAMEDQE